MFKERVLEITFNFSDNAPPVVINASDKAVQTATYSGYRAKVSIEQLLGNQQGTAQGVIYGINEDIANRLTTVGYIRATNRMNGIKIAAGNKGEALSLVYDGIIDTAYYTINQPTLELHFIAFTALTAAFNAVGASSYNGTVSVSLILQDLAKEAGYAYFEKSAIKHQLDNVYLDGSTWDKIQKVAIAAGINIHVKDNTLIVENESDVFKKPAEKTVSVETGLIGYPQISSNGLHFKTLFDPDFNIREPVLFESSMKVLNGTKWTPFRIFHELASNMPNGEWFTYLDCDKLGVELV